MVNTNLVRAFDDRLPQNIEAEQAVLGSLLIDSRAIDRVASFLRPDDFYLPVHTEIYRGMLVIFERDMPTDVVTVADHLQAQDRLDDMGGAAYLASLATQVPTSLNVEYYARIVERLAVLRRLVEAGNRISGIGYDERFEAAEALEQAEKILFEVSRLRVSRDFQPLARVLAEVYEKIDHIHAHDSEITGISTGYIDLDRMTSGFQRSDLIILAARPSMGKCLSAHMLVVDPRTGERKTIEECVKERLPFVHGVSDTGTVRAAPVGDWIDSGIQPCFRVVTRTGRSVEVTEHHPFLTVLGWVPLRELQAGSKIAVPRRLPCFGADSTTSPELVRLVAYFIARSELMGDLPRFNNTGPAIRQDFLRLLGEFFPECHVRRDSRTGAVILYGNAAGRNPVREWLKKLDLADIPAGSRAFPSIVWTFNRALLRQFVRTMMSCKASVHRSDCGTSIEFTAESADLVRDMQHALTRFGIVSTVESIPSFPYPFSPTGRRGAVERDCAPVLQPFPLKSTEYVGTLPSESPLAQIGRGGQGVRGDAEHVVYRLLITEPESIAMYETEIGWIGCPNSLSAHQTSPHLSPTWMSPAGGGVVRQFGRTQSHVDAAYLRAMGSPDMYWDEIVSIEPVGEQQVYDLCVPNGENFIAQDICVHNTALALNLAHAVALKERLPVGIFSVEMSAEQLAQRLLSLESQVDSQKLRTGRMSDMDWDRLVQAIGVLSEAPIFVDDTPGLSVVEMRSKARRLHTEQGLGLIIVDYLQLMHGASSESRVQEIAAISRGLKGVARELDVPVLALSQLSRAPEQRPNHEPMLSDLRESGCLTGDTLVYLPDTGKYQRIDELDTESATRVQAIDTADWKTKLRPVIRAFCTGRKPVFRLTTRTGRVIRATSNHKFLTMDGWERLDGLSTGQCIAIPRKTVSQATRTMTDSELALLAYLIGDGCTLPRHAIQFGTTDETMAEHVAACAREVFGDAVKPRVHAEPGAGRGVTYVDLSATGHLTHGIQNPVAQWLRDLHAFGLRSWEKMVPQRVFEQPDDAVGFFLRHLWVTDGCIRFREKSAPAIYYATSSPQLARDVQSLLLRLGIMSRLKRVSQGAKGRDNYHVIITGKPDVERFLEVVGPTGTQRTAHAARISEHLRTVVANTNRDLLPITTWRSIVVPAMQSAGITTRQMQNAIGTQYCGSTLYKPAMSRDRALKVASAVQSPELETLARSDVYWDEVVSIESDGIEDVYDLTVSDLHNFVANDIIVHNSIEQDADIVMFIYRDVVYNAETERPHVADIIVAKHRNGPTGKVHLFFQESLMRFLDLSISHDDYGG